MSASFSHSSSPVSLTLLLLTSAASLALLLAPALGAAAATAAAGGLPLRGGKDGESVVPPNRTDVAVSCAIVATGFPTLAEALVVGLLFVHLASCEAHIGSPAYAFSTLLALGLAVMLSACVCSAPSSAVWDTAPWGFAPLSVAAVQLVRMGFEVPPLFRFALGGAALSSHHLAALFAAQLAPFRPHSALALAAGALLGAPFARGAAGLRTRGLASAQRLSAPLAHLLALPSRASAAATTVAAAAAAFSAAAWRGLDRSRLATPAPTPAPAAGDGVGDDGAAAAAESAPAAANARERAGASAARRLEAALARGLGARGARRGGYERVPAEELGGEELGEDAAEGRPPVRGGAAGGAAATSGAAAGGAAEPAPAPAREAREARAGGARAGGGG